jgi:hypothetical protein
VPGGSPPPVRKTGNTPLPPPPIRRGGTPTPGTKAGTPLPPRPPVAGVKKPGAPPGVKKPGAPGGKPGAAAAPEEDKRVGMVVGKVKLIRRLGRGGMGDVYLGEHTMLMKQVAVKLLPQDFTRNEELLSRFRREAVAAARLEHPNIVQVMDVGNDGPHHFIVMQYVQGKSMQDLLDEAAGPMDLKEAARINMLAAQGLQAAHDAGIVHRDVKPANVMVSDKGEVKVMDFGLAHDQESQSLITMPGAMMGTPHFMSPEQAEGRPADNRSDIYSLGVMLYYAVTGQRPFVGESHMAVLFKHINEPPVSPRKLNPQIPDGLSKIVLKLLQKEPEKRYQSCTDAAKDLDLFLKGGFKAAPGAPVPSKPGTRTGPMRGGTSQLPQVKAHGKAAASNPQLTPLPHAKRGGSNKTLIFVASIVGMILVVALLAMAIIMQKKEDPKKEEKDPKPGKTGELPDKPPVKPVDDGVPAKYKDLIATAKDWELKNPSEAVKYYGMALEAWPQGKEAKEAIERLTAPAEDEKAFRAIEALVAAPGFAKSEALEQCAGFLEKYPASSRVQAVRDLQAMLLKPVETAPVATTAPKLEEGFEWLASSPAKFQAVFDRCRCIAHLEVKEDQIQIDVAQADKRHHIYTGADDLAEFIVKFDVKVETGAIILGLRVNAKAKVSQVEVPLEVVTGQWTSVEVGVTEGRAFISLDGKAPTTKDVTPSMGNAGKFSFWLSRDLKATVRWPRMKVIRRDDPGGGSSTSTNPPKDPPKDPPKNPPPVEPLDAVALAAVFGDGREVAARDYGPLIGRIEARLAGAPAVLEPNLARLNLAKKCVEAALANLAKTDGEFDVKMRDGQVTRVKVIKLVDRVLKVTNVAYGGEQEMAIGALHGETIVQFADRKPAVGDPAVAAFLVTEGELAAAMRRFFADAKKLKPGAEVEPFIDQVLAMDAAKQLKGGAKDVKALLDRFSAAADQLPAGAKEKINAILERMKTSAASEAVEAIRELAAKKPKEAVAKYLEWLKANPQEAAGTELANELYKAFMAEGWAKYWNEKELAPDFTVANGASGIVKANRGEISVTSPLGNTSMSLASLKSARGFAFEFTASDFKSNRGVSGLFSRRDGNVYKLISVFPGTWKLSDRMNDDWKGLAESNLSAPAAGRSIELAYFTAGEFGFVFVEGKLVHRMTAAEMTFNNSCTIIVDEVNATLKNFRYLK